MKALLVLLVLAPAVFCGHYNISATTVDNSVQAEVDDVVRQFNLSAMVRTALRNTTYGEVNADWMNTGLSGGVYGDSAKRLGAFVDYNVANSPFTVGAKVEKVPGADMSHYAYAQYEKDQLDAFAYVDDNTMGGNAHLNILNSPLSVFGGADMPNYFKVGDLEGFAGAEYDTMDLWAQAIARTNTSLEGHAKLNVTDNIRAWGDAYTTLKNLESGLYAQAGAELRETDLLAGAQADTNLALEAWAAKNLSSRIGAWAHATSQEFSNLFGEAGARVQVEDPLTAYGYANTNLDVKAAAEYNETSTPLSFSARAESNIKNLVDQLGYQGAVNYAKTDRLAASATWGNIDQFSAQATYDLPELKDIKGLNGFFWADGQVDATQFFKNPSGEVGLNYHSDIGLDYRIWYNTVTGFDARVSYGNDIDLNKYI